MSPEESYVTFFRAVSLSETCKATATYDHVEAFKVERTTRTRKVIEAEMSKFTRLVSLKSGEIEVQTAGYQADPSSSISLLFVVGYKKPGC